MIMKPRPIAGLEVKVTKIVEDPTSKVGKTAKTGSKNMTKINVANANLRIFLMVSYPLSVFFFRSFIISSGYLLYACFFNLSRFRFYAEQKTAVQISL